MEFRIVDAEKRHLDALVALEQSCFSVPWTRGQLTAELPDEHHEFLIAESGGEPIGYVGMMFVLDEGYVSNVAVSPEHRRQGIADNLIDHKAQVTSHYFILLCRFPWYAPPPDLSSPAGNLS